MTRFSIVLAAALLATAAQAQSPQVDRLLNRYGRLNDACRGGPGDSAKTMAACCSRQRVGIRLERLGWCYGKSEQTGADMEWHRCRRDSEHHDAGEYC